MFSSSFLSTTIRTLGRFCRYGVPSHILYFGDSLGDNLLLTTLCKALSGRGARNIWVKCDHYELFINNNDVKLVLPFQATLSSSLIRLFRVKVIHPVYTVYQKDIDRDLIPEKHIVLKMADCIPLKGEIENKPVFHLSPSEVTAGRLSSQVIVIVTSTSGAKVPMANKEWLHERYQQIVDRLSPRYQFVQLGTKGDAALKNVRDLRGKTTIRESAAILHNALLLVTHVGFMMHLARAVDCRAVIIYGGRENPAQSGYSCFNNIYSDISCSPCWLHNTCEFDRKCMKMITAERIVEIILGELKEPKVTPFVDKLYND
ncbi:glycosyltransferase family 9 protein [Mucilaginibacter flavus]|uniref:glycosyltransferase family 9 protein n=1 Tax=Mucilaginibacter flavus TaxID=931504 RepID=UPI0025B3D712|nr:glycosyltransferase family 9 protein [Mucilaginibacter flavus]MDN3584416.1 glycosyltransferase family 9 protein [Mucilaginibacter flavus]